MKRGGGISELVYAGLQRFGLGAGGNTAVEQCLKRLCPEGNTQELCREYYLEKIRKSLLILAVGGALCILLCIRAVMEERKILDASGTVTRGEYDEGEQELTLEAQAGDITQRYEISVQPRTLDADELGMLHDQFMTEVSELILGENESLQDVCSDLALESSYDGYPFDIDWKSSDVDAVSSSGEAGDLREARDVVLTAEITYGEGDEEGVNAWVERLEITVVPAELTEAEQQRLEIEEALLQAEAESRTESVWSLPKAWREQSLSWSAVADNPGPLAGILAAVISVLVFFLKDKDLRDELDRKKDRLRREYPDIVHQLALYLGAGLPLRGAFRKLAADYEQAREPGKPGKPAYEEVLYTCRELQTGVSEAQAYEHLGRRTGVQEYIRLCTLLAQNLKKGSTELLPRLREEAGNAAHEQLQNVRKLGEEASTKLLVPMVMMLAVVMIMILLPAFSSVK